MNKVPDYSRYTWGQLQDALTFIDNVEHPVQFAAIHAEIERRLNTPPLADPNQLPATSSMPEKRRWVWALCGWLWGFSIGMFAGRMAFIFLLTRVKAVQEGGGFSFLVCGFAGIVLCSTIGLLVGLRLSRPS